MSRGASARLFAALDPPEEVGEELLRWARGALRGAGVGKADRPALRLLDAESLHVTLLFLGERPLAEIDVMAEALATAAEQVRACELETGAPVWLPPRRPRALSVELHDHTGALGELQGALAGALCSVAGLPVPRRFRAHVTLARSRAAPGGGVPLAPTPALRFTAEEVVLYRSHLEPRAARYERLAAAPLMG
jgi:RNA 2',3'-cyclic 3'-phosphodiesterase